MGGGGRGAQIDAPATPHARKTTFKKPSLH